MAPPLDANAQATTESDGAMPEELNTTRLIRRLLELSGIGAVVGLVLLLGPGLGTLRSRLAQASPGWVAAAVGLEVLSALAYVVLFRAPLADPIEVTSIPRSRADCCASNPNRARTSHPARREPSRLLSNRRSRR